MLPTGSASSPNSQTADVSPSAWPTVFFSVALLAVVVGLGFTFFNMRQLFSTSNDPVWPEEQEDPQQPKVELFKGWPKPDVALVLSGQQYGYLQPCGCSRPQLGGLTRRFNFLNSLKDKGWPVVAVDLGYVADEAKRRNPQSLLKYDTSLKALNMMGYTAVGVGLNEIMMPLTDCLTGFPLQNDNKTPRVVATNLLGQKQGEPFHGMVDAMEIGTAGGDSPRVGVISLVGPGVEAQAKNFNVQFDRKTTAVLTKGLQDLEKQKADINVLLYQGPLEEAKKAAAWCDQQRKADPPLPQVHVILYWLEDTPPGLPLKVGDTLLITLGEKGKYVGVLGANRTANKNQPFEFRYQLVAVGPEFEQPEKGTKVADLMEEYTETLKNQQLWRKFARIKHPTQVEFEGAKFVGSNACWTCHKDAFKIWEKSGHSHAFQTLEKATNPKNRQFDGECILCHTVGFKYQTGFEDNVKTAHLRDVGCESCHGPGSEHIEQMRNGVDPKVIQQVNALINPWKQVPQAFRMTRIDQFCQSCHDMENDVNWNFAPKWKLVEHPTPPARAQANGAKVDGKK